MSEFLSSQVPHLLLHAENKRNSQNFLSKPTRILKRRILSAVIFGQYKKKGKKSTNPLVNQ